MSDAADRARGEFRRSGTEVVRHELNDLDLASTGELVRLMNVADRSVPEAVGEAAEAIAAAIDAIVSRLAGGGRLVYVGAGTSGRLGLLDAAECGPTFDSPPGQVLGILAGGSGALVDAKEGAEDDAQAGARSIEDHAIDRQDAVVGITASGRTPFVIGAILAARKRGALTIGLSCNEHAELSAEVDHPIEVLTGAELVAGSTRLKAGTAQKLVINTISTVTMIRLGKTYGNLMVDVRANNDKLRERAARIVEQAAGVNRSRALAALERSGYSAKTAIMILLAGITPDEATHLLAVHGGRLREALQAAQCA